MNPVVTIVGRANVGKSTLFNRLVGERRALVDDMPGVTRDRHYGDVDLYGRRFLVVDTGGYDPEATDDLLSLMRAQAQLAVQEADAIIFLLDGRDGLAPADELIAGELRQAKVPVYVAVNKLESPRRVAGAYDFYRLGVDELFFVSAEHGQGIADLLERVIEGLPVAPESSASDEGEDEEDDEVRVAVIGRPNVGKSTIINKLLGEERLLANDLPGTTRDAIDTVLEHDGKRYRLIDTAGVRRRRAIKRKLEAYSVIKSFKSIDRAHVVLLLMDATEPFVEQDARLAGMIRDKGRAVVLVFNKWDLVQKDTNTAGAFVKRLREHLKFMTWAPVVFVSAKTGQRVSKLLDWVDQVVANHRRRVQTARLNELLRDSLVRHQLPVYRSKRVKIFYLSQVTSRPPTFVGVANFPEAIHFSYHRFLINRLRESFDLAGTPVRLRFQKRSRRDRRQRRALAERQAEPGSVDGETTPDTTRS